MTTVELRDLSNQFQISNFFYKFLTSPQKEQANTDKILLEIELGKPVKKATSPSWRQREEIIQNIVQRYDNLLRYLELF